MIARHEIGTLEIKVRGVDVAPETLGGASSTWTAIGSYVVGDGGQPACRVG